MTDPTPRSVEQDFADQPKALSAAIEHLFSAGYPALDRARLAVSSGRPIILTGMGASHHVAVPLLYHLAARGLNAQLVETGELVRNRISLCRDALVVLISQSGDSVEIVQALDALPALNAQTIGVTNEPAGALARRADHPLLVNSPPDVIVAMQTYLGTLAVLLALSGRDSFRDAADFAPALDAISAVVANNRDDDFPDTDGPVYLFGRGPSFGSAQAGALVLHEAARMPAVAMTGGAFRHGPVEVVESRFRGIVFAPSDADLVLNQGLANDIRTAGGEVRLVGEKGDWCYPPLPAQLAPLVEIVPLQRAALHAARRRGLVPGEFRFATKVTRAESGLEAIMGGH